MTRRFSLFLVLSLLLLQTSCVDLSAIRKFTDTADDVGQHFPALANDYYRSCMQENYYAAMRRAQFRDQFNPVVVGSFARAVNDPGDPQIVPGPATIAIGKCKPY